MNPLILHAMSVKLNQEVKNVVIKILILKVVIFVKLFQEVVNVVNLIPHINLVMYALKILVL
jgi:hypothetical protein